MSKSIHAVVGALLCALFGLALAGPANAETGYARTGTFAATANDGGVTQTHNRRIAVNASTGDVYVTDTVGDRVNVYRPNATDADALTSFGTGSLTDPYGIAIDQASGDVYVSDSANSRIRKFTSDGAPTPTFTLDGAFTSPGAASALAFDQAADQLVYIDPTAQTIKRATTAGAATGAPFNGDSSGTAFTALQDLAVTSTGEIIVVDSTGDPALATGTSRIERYAADGSHNGTLGPVAGAATVAVIPDGDQILVSGFQDAVNTNDYTTLTVFANDGTQTAAFTSSEQYSIVTGVAAAGGSAARLYVASDASPLYGSAYGAASVQAWRPYTIPTVGTPSVSAVTGTAAHLSASVNPQGEAASYRFEISPDGSTWTAIDPDGDGDEDAGSGSVDTTVEADATGLTPNASYHVRVVVTKFGDPVTSDAAQFTTTLGPAVATTTPASAIRATSASLRGTINTYNAATTYRFEYGTTTAYGTAVPAADAAIAAGSGIKKVAQPVSGLTAGTTYHYRLVATNAAGSAHGDDQTFTTEPAATADTCPNAAIRAAQHSTHLPECRAYELVSPAEKNGYPVFYSPQLTGGLTRISDDGGAAVFTSFGIFAGANSGMPQTYRAVRSAAGWTTTSVTPPSDSVVPNPTTPAGWNNYWVWSTPDLRAGMLATRDTLDPTDRTVTLDIYTSDLAGKPTLVSRGNGAERTTDAVNSWPHGLSDDGSAALFQSEAHLVPADAPRLAGASDVYIREGEHTTLLQEKPDGTLLSTCGSLLGSGNDLWTSRNAITPNGDQVIFTVPGVNYSDPQPECAEPTQVYMRTADGQLTNISASRLATPEAPQSARFEGASVDGTRVIFTSDERLTEEASGGGVYVYDTQTSELRLAIPTTMSASTVFKISDDGRAIYLVSSDQLAPGSPAGGLYRYREDADGSSSTVFVAEDPANDIRYGVENLRKADVSRDGRTLVFETEARLTSFDNTNPRTGEAMREVYVYNDSQGLKCVSCDVAGQRPAGAEPTADARIAWGVSVVSRAGRSVSADGRRVFFQSSDRLVAADTNASQDVYEYVDGRVALVSGGTEAIKALLIGTDASGDSAMFVTSDSLVAGDVDGGNLDLYVARVNGGIPAQNVKPTSHDGCDGDACQGRPGAQAQAARPSSAVVAGPGDGPAPAARPSKAPIKVSVPRTVRGTSVKVQVRVPEKGTIRISGSGIATATAKAGKAGTSRLTVRLTVKARRTLARHRTLDVRIAVRFTPARGTARAARANVTFKQPKTKPKVARRAAAHSFDARNGEQS